MIGSAHSDRTRLLLAVSGELHQMGGDTFSTAKSLALAEIQRKFPGIRPAITDVSYEHDDGNFRLAAFSGEDFNAWAVRFSEPCSEVVGREWRVELLLSESDRVYFASRLSVYSEKYEFSFIPGAPRVLRALVERFTATPCGSRLAAEPIRILDFDDLAGLLDELLNQNRWWNVIVVSETHSEGGDAFAEKLQRGLTGVSNVYVLPADLEREFIGRVGKSFNVWGGAARTFRPGFDPASAEPFGHPVISRGQLYRAPQVLGYDAFEATTRRKALRKHVPAYIDVQKQMRAAQSRDADDNGVVSQAELVEALRREVRAGEEATNLAEELGAQAEQDRDQAIVQLDSERARNIALMHRIREYEATGVTPDILVAPSTYEELIHHIDDKLSNRLLLTPRARRSLKDAKFQKIDTVYQALIALYSYYVPMKLGEIDRLEYISFLGKHGLEDAPSIALSEAGKFGEEYYARRGAQKVFVDRHLKKGVAHDEARSLRVYFTYLDDEEVVLLHSLPAHLRNRLT